MRSPAPIVIALAAILLAAAPEIASIPPRARQNPRPDSAQDNSGTDSETTQGQNGIPVQLPKGKKLILTDGSFQLVREYSVDGDRVRYWSVERSAWEEIPAKLVDWDATHKDEAAQAAQDAELKAKIHASEVAERTKDIDVDRSLEIKPGLFLPDGMGFYVLEDKLIFEMKQSMTTSKTDEGREVGKILSGLPISTRVRLEIPGVRAALRVPTTEPEFFMRPADEREPHFQLVRAQIKGGNRVVENISIEWTGEQKHQGQDIEFQTWTPARGVFRYTFNQRLEPGEYAFVEVTREGLSEYVWDFGIDAPGAKTKK